MRRFVLTFISLLLFSTAVILQIPPVSAATLGDRVLSEGSQGDDVASLQQMLSLAGYEISDPSGQFGAKTAESLKQFQQDFGLPVTGVADSAFFQFIRTNRPQVDFIPVEPDGRFSKTVELVNKRYAALLSQFPSSPVETGYKQVHFTKTSKEALIPPAKDGYQLYAVKPGDTLPFIAAMYDTDYQSLMQANNLTSSILAIGQKVNVPAVGSRLKYLTISSATLRTDPAVDSAGIEEIAFASSVVQLETKGDWSHVLLQNGERGWLASYLLSDTLPSRAASHPVSPNSSREILGFYVDDSVPDSYETVVEHGNSLTSVAPFWYQLSSKADGSISTYANESNSVKLMTVAKKRNLKVLALIHNFVYQEPEKNRSLFHSVLKSQANQERFISQVLSLLERKGYDGINIDIEYVYPYDRDAFTDLITKLSSRLHNKGYLMTISLPAKVYDDRQNSFSGAFDYKRLGQACDEVLIMAYDEHWFGGEPGPIASLPWVKNVADYTLRQMPASKILLGISAYAYDWNTSGGKTASLSYAAAVSRLVRYHGLLKWNDQSSSPFYTYTDNNGQSHTVWFENSYSLSLKLDLVNRYNLQGIGIWRLGLEDPDYWQAINKKFNGK